MKMYIVVSQSKKKEFQLFQPLGAVVCLYSIDKHV